MILLKNEETGFVITLDDTSEDGYIVGATDELRDELTNDREILKEMIDQRSRVISFYVEQAEQSPDIPSVERQIADKLISEGYELISETEVDNISDDGDLDISVY
jgi:hypothetical protein